MDLYKAKVYLNDTSLSSVLEWISKHEQDSLRLDFTHFEDGTLDFRAPVVSLYKADTTFEESVPYWNRKEDKCEVMNGVRVYRALMSMYYIECHGNVYYATF